jgi:hypothetical protein
MAIEAIVRSNAVQQENGRWIFEGKDTFSWEGEAGHHRRVLQKARQGQYPISLEDRQAMMLEAMEIADILLLLDTQTLAQAQVAALDDRGDIPPSLIESTHSCAHCGTPLVDTVWPYAYCEQCQETQCCQHGVLYKEDCNGCNTLSDFAYDAWREKH